jgi:hypothetical protein
MAIVRRGCDVLAFDNYDAAARCQSRAFADDLELRSSNGIGAHGKRRPSLLSSKWEAPLHVGQVRHGVNVE